MNRDLVCVIHLEPSRDSLLYRQLSGVSSEILNEFGVDSSHLFKKHCTVTGFFSVTLNSALRDGVCFSPLEKPADQNPSVVASLAAVKRELASAVLAALGNPSEGNHPPSLDRLIKNGQRTYDSPVVPYDLVLKPGRSDVWLNSPGSRFSFSLISSSSGHVLIPLECQSLQRKLITDLPSRIECAMEKLNATVHRHKHWYKACQPCPTTTTFGWNPPLSSLDEASDPFFFKKRPASSLSSGSTQIPTDENCDIVSETASPTSTRSFSNTGSIARIPQNLATDLSESSLGASGLRRCWQSEFDSPTSNKNLCRSFSSLDCSTEQSPPNTGEETTDFADPAICVKRMCHVSVAANRPKCVQEQIQRIVSSQVTCSSEELPSWDLVLYALDRDCHFAEDPDAVHASRAPLLSASQPTHPPAPPRDTPAPLSCNISPLKGPPSPHNSLTVWTPDEYLLPLVELLRVRNVCRTVIEVSA